MNLTTENATKLLPMLLTLKDMNLRDSDLHDMLARVATFRPGHKKLTISGYSDDIVQIDVNDSHSGEEFSGYNSSKKSPVILRFSDGTEARVWYDKEGVWRIAHEPGSIHCLYTHVPRPTDDDGSGDCYTETLTIEGPIDWVACLERAGKEA